MARSSDTEQRIVDAARRLWHVRSYADVGVNEICEAADVRKGSFYHYFPAKHDLAIAVIDDHWREAYEHVVLPTRAEGGTPLEQLDKLVERVGMSVRRSADELGVVPGCPFGNLAVELSTIDSDVRDRLVRLFADQQAVLKGLLDDAVAAEELPAQTDTAEVARAMNAYIEGILLLAKNANDASLVEELLPLTMRLAVPATTPVETAAA